MRKLLKISIIVILSGLAFPCSCLEPPPPEEAFEEADAVFSGQVINIVEDGSNYYYEVSIQTIDVWKGEILDELIVLTETTSSECGYNFQINNEYLIYGYNYGDAIYTNICTRTNLLQSASEDLDYLNGIDNNETSLDFEDEVQLFQESAHQKFPEVVSSVDGTFHLVWVRELGSNKNVMYSQSIDEGVTFSDPLQINQNNNSIVAFIQAGPKIKVRGNEVLIIYMDHRSGLTSIYMNRSLDYGSSWSEDILISDQSYLQAYPDFEIDPDGTIHLVYYSYNQNNSFNSVRYTSAVSGLIEFEASVPIGITNASQEPCDCCQPDLEISAVGDIYLAYRNNINDIRDTYVAIKPNGSDIFNQIVRASFHNDYNNHCPSSGPSMVINDNIIALSYRVSDAATSYINYSDITTLSFDNEVNINLPAASPNFADITLHNEVIHVGWIDYETDNPDVLYGVSQIASGELVNVQRMNQNVEEGYIMQKDPKLYWHDDKLFYFWSDKRGTFYQLYYRKSIANIITGDINSDGQVNILDIVSLVSIILGTAPENPAGDLNQDGVYNILDIVQLVNIILN